MNRMQPHEALGYITQLCNDYIRTLSPSAQGPVGEAAQLALDALKPLVIGAVPNAGVTPDAGPLESEQA